MTPLPVLCFGLYREQSGTGQLAGCVLLALPLPLDQIYQTYNWHLLPYSDERISGKPKAIPDLCHIICFHVTSMAHKKTKVIVDFREETDTLAPYTFNSTTNFDNAFSTRLYSLHQMVLPYFSCTPCISPLAGHGKNHKDAASVRATHPIPAACGIYYFEVKIVSKGRDG